MHSTVMIDAFSHRCLPAGGRSPLPLPLLVLLIQYQAPY